MTGTDGGARTVETDDGVRLHARLDPAHDGPSARTLLVVNSLGCALEMWDEQLEAWRATHHVLRYDQRGHGRSDAPDGPYDLDRLGQDALAVLDAFGLERVDVCGLSLGGLVAQWLCLEAAPRIRRAVFANTAARVGTREGWSERAALVRSDGMAAVTEAVLERFFSPAALAAELPSVARTRAMLAGLDPEGYASSCDALASADLRTASPAITHRCLVVSGSADVATPPGVGRELVTALPDATFAELHGAGHLSNLERPADFAALVRDFLAAPDAAPDAAPGA
jgi:3-oxoadipate enol-lactonase